MRDVLEGFLPSINCEILHNLLFAALMLGSLLTL